MIIAVFPGQGSQTPGFLSPWLDVDGARERLQAASDAAGVDLLAAGTEWDADRIRDTAVAQPLIVAASLLSWDALVAHAPARPAGVAGHSVGEISALVAAGVLTEHEGMRLVGIRGRAMADAAAAEQSGMSAVIGGDQDAVVARLSELDLAPANYNGGGQIVAAGASAALAELAATPVAGTRVIPLQVAGAFHTRYMLPAVETLRTAAADVQPADPAVTLWTNHDGSTVSGGREALDLLVAQVASPVRWDLCMASFAEHGVTGIIELSPAGTLTGLAKRALRGVPTVAVKTPDDLAAAAAMLGA
ncbi:ACP S-malonyltransferase [Microbacterium sp. zg.Y1090]|uniref:ACP S-malonyltransferase n=1 Tax=Microbacterium TaxID=33882 RepID=UPI00214D0E23|nr:MULTISPECIES: ACP S-malonyltransferase [unclassified Microbacterium]MCR2811804.1 ACP S-malonyltransferase [Microbacterium sp. zg.Y1084]MCR2818758.1 ACP S-malonyltransferase [Microbacterium sp. zg.Y1090]MDL5486848.1 ACP S-malonyltransferase [Microbacterium sp. zg-Y1211]WIM27076.1 ACP S-malonyltransferase [Microbacterium sp. zg-Y1090]